MGGSTKPHGSQGRAKNRPENNTTKLEEMSLRVSFCNQPTILFLDGLHHS